MEVVLCAFPYVEMPERPGPKAHPCILLGECVHQGQKYALVVYGTSKMNTFHQERGVICVRAENRIDWPWLTDVEHPITYFVGASVALVPKNTWFFPDYQKGGIKDEAITAYELSEFVETSRLAAKRVFEHFMTTGKVGRH